LWNTFIENANAYAKQGSDQATVVRQAFQTLQPIMNSVFEEMNAGVEGLKNAAEALLHDQLNPIYDSFRNALKPADEFNEQLGSILNAFSRSDVVAVYAQQIIDAAAAQRKHGYEVTGFVAELEQASKDLLKTQSDTQEALRQSQLKNAVPQTGLAQSASKLFASTVESIKSIVDSVPTSTELVDALSGLVAQKQSVAAPVPQAASAQSSAVQTTTTNPAVIPQIQSPASFVSEAAAQLKALADSFSAMLRNMGDGLRDLFTGIDDAIAGLGDSLGARMGPLSDALRSLLGPVDELDGRLRSVIDAFARADKIAATYARDLAIANGGRLFDNVTAAVRSLSEAPAEFPTVLTARPAAALPVSPRIENQQSQNLTVNIEHGPINLTITANGITPQQVKDEIMPEIKRHFKTNRNGDAADIARSLMNYQKGIVSVAG